MADFLTTLHRNPLTSRLARSMGVPKPVELLRAKEGYEALPFSGKNILVHQTRHGYAAPALLAALKGGGGEPLGLLPDSDGRGIDILVVDATCFPSHLDCYALYNAFHPVMRRLARNARVLIAASLPHDNNDPAEAAVVRGIEGFMRSISKELGKNGTIVNMAYIARDAVDRLEGVVRFFCGPQATYVSGQVVYVTERVAKPSALPCTATMAGKVALVTGGGRGIGAAIAERLIQEDARVICLDVPAASNDLHRTCTRIGAVPLEMDIAGPNTAAQLAAFLRDRFGGLDILVHNAGITRDRTLANMSKDEWGKVVRINFGAVVDIDRWLLEAAVLRDEARIVCLSSISGIAGNFGQANYALTKAALIGYVAAQASRLASRGICVNAVAPGFIETAMTEKMPFFTREVGRQLNSLKQGGRPRDVAELIAFLSTPGAYGISGQTIRVCGQGLVGA